MSLVLYHEKQAAALCGQHCLNNLMQAPIFDLETLTKIAHNLDEEERALMLAGGCDTPAALKFLAEDSGNVDGSGNFSLQVLRIALQKHGVALVDSQHKSMANVDIDVTAVKAFVCNLQSHWFTLRNINGRWFNLNSLLKDGPEHISDFYLNAYLAQLRGEGWRIFIVRGVLPDINLATSFAVPSRIFYIADVMKKKKEQAKNKSREEIAATMGASKSSTATVGNRRKREQGVYDDEDARLARAIAASLEGGASSAPALPPVVDMSEEASGAEDESGEEDDASLQIALAMSLGGAGTES
eukprot:g3409.t1